MEGAAPEEAVDVAPSPAPKAERATVPRAPMAPAAGAMVAGIVLGRYLAGPPAVWLAGAGACVAAGMVLAWRGRAVRAAAACVAAGVVLAAAGAADVAYHRVPGDHIVNYSDRAGVMATIRGRVASDPTTRDFGEGSWRRPQTAMVVDATGIRATDGAWLDATGAVRVTVKEPLNGVGAGDEVELVGQLSRPRPPGNPGQYDRRRADRYRGILVAFTVPGADGVRRLSEASAGPRRLWRRLRAAARAHVTGLGDSRETLLLEALVLGARRPALAPLNRAMAEAGVAHLLSISGLHLGIFLGFVYWLCRLAAVPKRRAAGVVLAVLAIYVLVAEPRAPLLRGAIMAAAVCVGVIVDRRLSVLNALATAAVVLLAADPLQLFTPGFQLSFTIVTGVVVLNGGIRRLVFGRWLKRRELMVFPPARRLRRWVYYGPAEWLIALVCVSAAAYVSAAPLVAYHFGIFSPYAAVLSMLLLPLVAAVLVPAYLSLGLSWLMPNASWQLGRLAGWAGGLLERTVLSLHRLGGLSVQAYPLPVGLVVLCYAAIGAWAVSGRIRRGRMLAAGLTLTALGWCAWAQRPAPPPDGADLHVLDIGHGQAILLRTADGGTVLFDAGSVNPGSMYDSVLRPFLRTARLPAPRAVFLSHPHSDHYNMLPEILRRHPPRTIYLNESFGADPAPEPGLARLMDSLERAGVEIVRLRAGQRVDLGGGAGVEVIWPGGGDIEEPVQAELAGRADGSIAADVLVLPHHGNVTRALKGFIAAVGADTLVQSAEWRHDSPAMLDAIATRRRLATFRDGYIRIGLRADGVEVSTMRKR